MKILFLAGHEAEAKRVKAKWPDIMVGSLTRIPAIMADLVIVEPLPDRPTNKRERELHADAVKYAAHRYINPLAPVIVGRLV